MNHKLIAGLAGIALVFGGSAAFADDYTGDSNEGTQRTADETTPGASQHTDDDGNTIWYVDQNGNESYDPGEETYEDEDNQVDCNQDPNDADDVNATEDVSVQYDQNPDADGGAVVVCKDGGDDIQGRVYVQGNPSAEGGHGSVAIDGDADNPEQVTGYARVDHEGNVECGDGDSADDDDHSDTSRECGG